MALIVSDPPARWSGTFTRNRVKAAPVQIGMERLRKGVPLSVILVNSGNANACTGERGVRDAQLLCREAAHLLGVPENQVIMASTGVIGHPLPLKRMKSALPTLVRNLGQSSLADVAQAIMTTDRYPKWEIIPVQGYPEIWVAGVVKGAGMISPSMATMLGFFFTNAGMPLSALHPITHQAVMNSFNRIKVDGDQSTNDTVLVLDNGAAHEGTPENRLKGAISYTLEKIMRSLAWKIVDNGEGVTKVVTIVVETAKTEEEARRIAESVGNSPLVKTAFYGEDPNWGRIMAAIGYAGAEINPEDIDILFDDVTLASKGHGTGKLAEQRAADVMKRHDYTVRIILRQGSSSYRIITSDLSAEYVKINADYRS